MGGAIISTGAELEVIGTETDAVVVFSSAGCILEYRESISKDMGL